MSNLTIRSTFAVDEDSQIQPRVFDTRQEAEDYVAKRSAHLELHRLADQVVNAAYGQHHRNPHFSGLLRSTAMTEQGRDALRALLIFAEAHYSK